MRRFALPRLTRLNDSPDVLVLFTWSVIVAKQPANHGKSWKPAEVEELKHLAKENTPTRVIGLKLGRTPEAVQSKASEESISLKPTNQSPYNRQK